MPARKAVTVVDGRRFITCTACRNSKELTPDNFSADDSTSLGIRYECRECMNARMNKSYHALSKPIRDIRNKRNTERSRERRTEVLAHYSDGDIKCLCCGEREQKFLALDHVHGGGNQHRIDLGIKGGGQNFYVWVIRHNFPEGFQVLCHNCNMAKGFYGQCPHQKAA